jgi:CubicO group peptidase (beta-lactamase class C family)
MTDTTFWPTSDQVRRLAKTYKPNELSNALEETTTQFLRYPLDDRKRTAMAAGGLFSTASDVVKFCRMYLNNGALDGVRYLSEDSIRELTHGRKMENLDVGMGLCWYVDATSYSHGGALSTNMSVYPDADRALVFLVQHIGFPNNGAEALGAFKKAALGLDNS